MACPIRVLDVQVLNNPSMFQDPFQIQITFECCEPGIRSELEWKLVYVGSAEDESRDQLLDSVLVGPVQIGKSKFVFEADAPDLAKIPSTDVLDVTVLLLTCSYESNEFIRIGYYVNNEYPEELLPPKPEAMEIEGSETGIATENNRSDEALDEDAAMDQEMEEDAEEEEDQDDDDQDCQQEQPRVPADFVFDITLLKRHIVAEAPRVTRFDIPWDRDEKQSRLDDFLKQEREESQANPGMRSI